MFGSGRFGFLGIVDFMELVDVGTPALLDFKGAKGGCIHKE